MLLDVGRSTRPELPSYQAVTKATEIFPARSQRFPSKQPSSLFIRSKQLGEVPVFYFRLFACSLMCAALCCAADPVHDIEARVKSMYSQTDDAAKRMLEFQREQRRTFEDRFNRLVEAVEKFAVDYNTNKGQVWPHEKAEALRRAMLDLQKQEMAFRKEAKQKDRRDSEVQP